MYYLLYEFYDSIIIDGSNIGVVPPHTTVLQMITCEILALDNYFPRI